MNEFQFYSGPVEDVIPQAREVGAYVAFVPARVTHRDDLFKILQHELQLPDYFGNNWDALEECLKDLNWLKQFPVIRLIHARLPHFTKHKSGKVSPVIYLEILRDAIAQSANRERRLEVFFPDQDREQISKLLAGAPDDQHD